MKSVQNSQIFKRKVVNIQSRNNISFILIMNADDQEEEM